MVIGYLYVEFTFVLMYYQGECNMASFLLGLERFIPEKEIER